VISSDLVSRLLEAITAKEEKARAAKGLSVLLDWPRRNGKATLRAFLDDNDPDSVLRRCAADKATVEEWLKQSADPYEGMNDDEMHARCVHPAYEYAVTQGPRKAWDYADEPPDGDGWERNTAEGRDGWDRFDYTEESYWRRLRPGGPQLLQRPVPYFIRNLLEGYGLSDHQEGEE
jgi:hypothetical protein